MPEAARIRSMFAAIAGRYDLVNRVLTCGIDRRWRRLAVRALELRPGAAVLDVCAGTGDVALELARVGATVVGADFCPEMLGLAQSKARRGAAGRARFLCADTLGLPFRGACFDAATVA